MALSATIFKADLQITDMDRNYYQSHNLTIAQHPSETPQRMMVRILAFALNANEDLVFAKGLSSDDEPEIWHKTLTDEIELWIDLGQPDEKRIRKACARAKQVIIYSYTSHSAEIWWQQIKSKVSRFGNLRVINIPEVQVAELENLVQRTMRLQCTILDGEVWLADDERNLEITLGIWK